MIEDGVGVDNDVDGDDDGDSNQGEHSQILIHPVL